MVSRSLLPTRGRSKWPSPSRVSRGLPTPPAFFLNCSGKADPPRVVDLKGWLLFLLSLLLREGVHPNPGPLSFPCGRCSRQVTFRGFSVRCSSCLLWFHQSCTSLSKSFCRSLSSSHSWVCSVCSPPPPPGSPLLPRLFCPSLVLFSLLRPLRLLLPPPLLVLSPPPLSSSISLLVLLLLPLSPPPLTPRLLSPFLLLLLRLSLLALLVRLPPGLSLLPRSVL